MIFCMLFMRSSLLLVHPLMILNVAGIINFPFYSCKAGTHHYIATLLLGHSRPTTFYIHSDKRFTLTEWTHTSTILRCSHFKWGTYACLFLGSTQNPNASCSRVRKWFRWYKVPKTLREQFLWIKPVLHVGTF